MDYKSICDEVAELAKYSRYIEPIYAYGFLFRILLISTLCISIVILLALLRLLVAKITDILDYIMLVLIIYHTRYYWHIFFRLFYALSFVIIIHISPENFKIILEELSTYYLNYISERSIYTTCYSTSPGKGEPSDQTSDRK